VDRPSSSMLFSEVELLMAEEFLSPLKPPWRCVKGAMGLRAVHPDEYLGSLQSYTTNTSFVH
jgi:hypothetical protein